MTTVGARMMRSGRCSCSRQRRKRRAAHAASLRRARWRRHRFAASSGLRPFLVLKPLPSLPKSRFTDHAQGRPRARQGRGAGGEDARRHPAADERAEAANLGCVLLGRGASVLSFVDAAAVVGLGCGFKASAACARRTAAACCSSRPARRLRRPSPPPFACALTHPPPPDCRARPSPNF